MERNYNQMKFMISYENQFKRLIWEHAVGADHYLIYILPHTEEVRKYITNDCYLLTQKYEKTDITSFDVFLESLGSYRTIFENKSAKELKAILKQPNWDSETKGTPKQYFKFLSGMELEKLCSFYGS